MTLVLVSFLPHVLAANSSPPRTTGNIVATIVVGPEPNEIVYNPFNHKVYVSGWQTIWIIDSSTNKVTGQFSGVSGFNLAFDSNKSYLYASDDYANTVQVVNTLTGKLIKSVPVCQWCDPSGMAFNPGNGRIYLANFGMGKVSVISDTTNNIVATITVGSNPFGALYDPLNQKVYISDYSSAVLSKIDPVTNTVIANLSAGNGPWNIALDTVNGLLYVTNLGSDTVTVIYP